MRMHVEIGTISRAFLLEVANMKWEVVSHPQLWQTSLRSKCSLSYVLHSPHSHHDHVIRVPIRDHCIVIILH